MRPLFFSHRSSQRGESYRVLKKDINPRAARGGWGAAFFGRFSVFSTRLITRTTTSCQKSVLKEPPPQGGKNAEIKYQPKKGQKGQKKG